MFEVGDARVPSGETPPGTEVGDVLVGFNLFDKENRWLVRVVAREQ